MRRFYKSASAVPAEGGFCIVLDAKPVRTPGKKPLIVPFEALAHEIAEEWASQTETIDPGSMRLTRLANTVVDNVAGRRGEVVDEVARFAETDLVCYRVAEPETLRLRQETRWDPLLDWTRQELGAALAVTKGVLPQSQSDEAVAVLRASVEAFDDFRLTALHVATAAAGSIVIGLALCHGRVDADEAWSLSLIEEYFQAELWGADAEAEARREALREEFAVVEQFVALCEAGLPA